MCVCVCVCLCVHVRARVRDRACVRAHTCRGPTSPTSVREKEGSPSLPALPTVVQHCPGQGAECAIFSPAVPPSVLNSLEVYLLQRPFF